MLQWSGPAARAWGWQVKGSCRALGFKTFSHPDGERGQARRSRAEAAKSVCDGCPVLRECRNHALSVREPYGVWGGLTESEREAFYTEDETKSA